MVHDFMPFRKSPSAGNGGTSDIAQFVAVHSIGQR